MVAGLASHFVFDFVPSGCLTLQFVHMLFVTQCSSQGHSQIYRVGDMLKVIFKFLLASRFLRWKAHVCVLSGFARKGFLS